MFGAISRLCVPRSLLAINSATFFYTAVCAVRLY
jgi:hypothetical protein